MLADPPNAFFSSFAFISVVIALIPFHIHYRARNIGVCLFMAWAAVGCLNAFINSVVWNNSIKNSAPVWCDISTRIMIAGELAYSTSNLCIARQLYLQFSNKSWSMRKLELVVDLFFGLGIPFLDVILSYIVQGNRFDIYENVGCQPALVDMPPTYALVYSLPLIVSTAILILGVLIVRRHIISRHTDPTYDRTLLASFYDMSSRKLILCVGYALVTIPVTVHSMVVSMKKGGGFTQWPGWAAVHAQRSVVNTIPVAEWRAAANLAETLELGRWGLVINAIYSFWLFGFVEEAPREYRRILRTMRVWLRGASGKEYAER
ncbi:fungal pheromone STE3G-protein-coupled receptor [Artomyces pyxidatus]|uniref:Fungal pheromone STE3G-protein-coupled receptor n=1 Tax=Artomyces pyxidatus TaxID=48021 RepID=A0ACB8SQL5_9AGAM|nr:fungal pheromone STE3G-protein-coupled receptor [Artomyces pyxidatus]